MASDRDKPDGLTVVAPGDERAFLAPLPIRDLWGVGPRTAERLSKAGVTTIGELAERPLPWLIERFGVRGEWFYRLARGEDDRPVSTSREAKSISAEQTFAEDLADPEALAEVVREQAARVARRLRKAQLRSRTVQLKLRLADFTTFTRRRTLPVATDQAGPIQSAALEMLAAEAVGGRRFRLVGTGVSNLIEAEEAAQLSLFDPLPAPARAAALRETVGALRDRYGDESVDWGVGRSQGQSRERVAGAGIGWRSGGAAWRERAEARGEARPSPARPAAGMPRLGGAAWRATAAPPTTTRSWSAPRRASCSAAARSSRCARGGPASRRPTCGRATGRCGSWGRTSRSTRRPTRTTTTPSATASCCCTGARSRTCRRRSSRRR